MTDQDTVVVSVPADARFLPVVRVAVAAAAMGGVQFVNRLDDLRLAVDELTASCIAAACPDARIAVRVHAHPDHVRVEGRVRTDGTPPALSDVGRALVAGTTTGHRLRDVNGLAIFEFTVGTDEAPA